MSVGNNKGYPLLPNSTMVRDFYTRVVTHWSIGLLKMRSINYLYYLSREVYGHNVLFRSNER